MSYFMDKTLKLSYLFILNIKINLWKKSLVGIIPSGLVPLHKVPTWDKIIFLIFQMV